MLIGEYIRSRQADGANDREILREVHEKFVGAKTTLNSVRWYRSQANRQGERRPRTPGAHAGHAGEPRGPETTSIPDFLTENGVELRPGQRGFYYIGAAKTVRGVSTRGFTATLYAGGAKVAEVVNDGSGAPATFHFLDEGLAEKIPIWVPRWDGEKVRHVVTPLEAHWLDHCAALPKILVRDHPGETVHVSPDIEVSRLVDEFLVARNLSRIMASKVAYVKGGRLFEVPLAEGMTVDRLRRSIEEKHPDATVLNGMPLKEAVRLVP